MTTANTLVLLGTGGTIAGQATSAQDPLAYRSAQIGVETLAAGLVLPPGLRLVSEQVAQVDSKDMGPAVWRPLLAAVQQALLRPEVKGVVITHGTDTLEETAYLLQAVLNPAKPVVLASAMRPATALGADGPQNLQDALWVAAEPEVRGVMAVNAGYIHGALAVQKEHPYRLQAFGSGDVGPWGSVTGGRCLWWHPRTTTTCQHQPAWLEHLLAAPEWPRVEWLSSHGGATGAIVRALLQPSVAGDASVQGLVVAGTGNGTLHETLLAALRQAQAAGVVVWRTTRCAQGRVVPVGDDPGLPVIDLPPAKARLALMLELLAAAP